MSKIELIPLVAAQAPILAALHAEGFDKPWPPEAFVRLLENPARRGALALAAAAPQGFILLQQTPDETEVLTFVVACARRRHGIGAKLLEWAVETTRLAGCARLLLEVAETNDAARALYDKLGFREIGARSGYYRRSQGTETALLLERLVVAPSGNR